LAEIRRRRFHVHDALAGLREGEGGVALPQLALAEANAWWTIGDVKQAMPRYRAALHAWTDAGDRDGRLAALIGLARCDRVVLAGRERPALAEALAAARGVGDEHLLADLRREQAAWALLSDDHVEAARLADAASAVHAAVGDSYLKGLADVLSARAVNAAGDNETAISRILTIRATAVRIDAFDLEQICVVYAGQFLQRGAAPDSDRWRQAMDLLSVGLDAATDPFTRAEMLLPMAQLHLAAAEFDRAETELADYQRLYAIIGGNRLSAANLLKARARLELARAGDNPWRAATRTPAALRAVHSARRMLRKAARAYEDAGLDSGMHTVMGHLRAIDVLALGSVRRGGSTGGADRLNTALQQLLEGTRQQAGGDWHRARAAYVEAEAAALDSGATMIAVQAASGRAEVALGAGETAEVLASIRSMLGHAESIRAAVTVGPPRGSVAAVLRSEYERMAVLAARTGAADLLLEIVERLRTERLAGLLRRSAQALPEEVRTLLKQLDDVNAALVTTAPGVRSVFSASVVDLAHLPAGELTERLHDLRAELARRTNALFADTYGAVPVDQENILGVRSDVLALLPVLDGETPIVLAVWRAATGESAVTVTPLDREALALRDALNRPGRAGVVDRCNLTSRDLAPVRRMLPAALLATLRDAPHPTRLTVVPSSWLWAVPFAGIPLSDTDSAVLVDVADIALAPSLRMAAELGMRGRNQRGRPHSAVSWVATRSGISAPEVAALDAHGAGHVRLDSPDAVQGAFVDGGERFRIAVVAAHGNREPGLGHAVTEGGRAVLAAADYLDGGPVPPPVLSLASCHSGYPDSDDPHEPLGLALAALTAGVDHVVSSTFELDSLPGPATTCLVSCA
jgi:hypothetical protein